MAEVNLLIYGGNMKKIGIVLVLFSLLILIILPKIIFPESDTVDSTGIVNAIRFTGLSLILSAIGIKLFFKDK